MTISECQVETQKHIERVRYYIRLFTDKLTTRGVNHDHCKLESPEVEVFAEHTGALATTGYATPEYKKHMEAMKPALDHHYAQSRHHPEHFDDGILGMNLIDLCEMFCDWKAATERHNDGNLLKSIQINAQRFGYDDQLKRIFLNTAKLFDENQVERSNPMRCIVCDRCKAIIENPRRCRVITCARPLNSYMTCDKGHIPYRGNDPQQNDLIWTREICEKCLDELDSFFEAGGSSDTPENPNPPADDTEDTESEDEDGDP